MEAKTASMIWTDVLLKHHNAKISKIKVNMSLTPLALDTLHTSSSISDI